MSTGDCADAPVQYVDTITLPQGLEYDGCLVSSYHPANAACATDDDTDADAATGPQQRCPSSCAAEAPAPTAAPRVRRALHTLSDDEWQRVVDAFWVMRNTETTEGQARFGKSYRGWDYWTLLHLVANLPPYDPERACLVSHGAPSCLEGHSVAGKGEDVTGGGQQQLIWHSLLLQQFETSLLAVDASIGGLPYLDWAASSADGARDLFAKAGTPSCDAASYQGSDGKKDVCILDAGPFANWPVLQSWDPEGYFGSNPGSVEDVAVWRAILADGASDSFPIATICSGPRRARGCPGALLFRGDPSWVEPSWGTAEFSANLSAALAYCVEGAPSWRFSELAACYEARLADQWSGSAFPGFHTLMHTWLGGDMLNGAYAFIDPMAWFHHAGGDWLLREWQDRNPQLRATAFGYPVEPAYNLTPIGLHDCAGCSAYGLGFSLGVEGGSAVGSLTAADVLCGEVQTLYTYDTILERHLAAQQLEGARSSNAALALVVGMVIGCVMGVAVLSATQRRRARRNPDGKAVRTLEPWEAGRSHRSHRLA